MWDSSNDNDYSRCRPVRHRLSLVWTYFMYVRNNKSLIPCPSATTHLASWLRNLPKKITKKQEHHKMVMLLFFIDYI